MPIINELHKAKFRGVEFLVNSENRNGGKKTISHEYVNSDKRYTEELGKIPASFTLEIIVTSLEQRFRLEKALDEPGLGELVHPVYGSQMVKSTTYSVSSRQNRIGEFLFSVNFELSEANITAKPAVPTPSAVTSAKKNAMDALNNAVAENFKPSTTPAVFTASADKLTEIYDEVFATISDVVNPVQEKIADFTREVSNGISNVNSIVQQGETLKTALIDLYSSASSVVDMPSELTTQWSDLTDFSALETPGKTNTVPRATIESNRQVLNDHAKTVALINYYEAAAYKTYSTTDELDEVRSELDALYIEAITADDRPLAQEPNTRAALTELKVVAKEIFEQKEQQLWKIVTINPGLSSLALASFRYYGGLDELPVLQGLNQSINHSHFDGDITAVQK